jgi:hypothetical protein
MGKTMIRDIIRQWFTESDNATHDLTRVLAAVSILTGLGLQIYAVGWHGQPFDMQTFGVGTGALFGGLGVALKLKKESSDA